MTTQSKENEAQPRLVDLFDLPTDAPPSAWSEPEDAPRPPASEPRATSSSRTAPAMPAAAVEITAAESSGSAEGVAPGEARKTRKLRWLWIGLGATAVVNVLVLVIPFGSHDAPPEVSEDPAHATVPASTDPASLEPASADPAVAVPIATDPPAADPAVGHEETHAITPKAPAVPTDHTALAAARAALRAAEADLSAGRRAEARARLGRVLLAIDSVEPREREEIHAAVALLVARSLQADADEARRSVR